MFQDRLSSPARLRNLHHPQPQSQELIVTSLRLGHFCKDAKGVLGAPPGGAEKEMPEKAYDTQPGTFRWGRLTWR